MHLRHAGCSSPTTSCGTPAILRRSSCEGCAWVTSQVRELSYTHSRDVTCATLCQGPYEESVRYPDFMGWEMPCYSAQGSLDTLLVGRRVGMMHIVCYLRQGSNVFETYWATMRNVEAMDNSYPVARPDRLRQEMWEDSPTGWPRRFKGKQVTRTDGRLCRLLFIQDRSPLRR